MCASLEDTDTNDCHSEQYQQAIYSREKHIKYSELSNVFGIADDTWVVGHNENCRDHDHPLRRVLDVQRSKSKTKQR